MDSPDNPDLGAAIVVAQALCLTISNLSPTQKTCLSNDGYKASECVASQGDLDSDSCFMTRLGSSDSESRSRLAQACLVLVLLLKNRSVTQ